MRTIAAHAIFCKQAYRLSYLELDHTNRFHRIQPLQEEMAGTAFYDGLLVVVPDNSVLTPSLVDEWMLQYGTDNIFTLLERTRITAEIVPDDVVSVYFLRGVNLSAPELRTHNGRCHCHIERL